MSFENKIKGAGDLVLKIARKLGESVVIANNITVKVVEVTGKTVKLGIDFPRDVSVHREEVYKRIQYENKLAAHSTKLLELLKKVSDIHDEK